MKMFINNLKKRLSKLTQDSSKSGNEEIQAINQIYSQLKKEANVMDFHDLIILSVKILKDHPAVLEDFNSLYRYILVDEFQDTSKTQFELLRLLGRHGRYTIYNFYITPSSCFL
jgi:DNA helicase-2/ATP-dependent DNA helicase PcrA